MSGQGQLYQIVVVGRLIDSNCLQRSAFLTCASSKEDCEKKIRWHMDVSLYEGFRVLSCDRVKPFHQLWSSTTKVADDGRPIPDTDDRQRYSVGISGTLLARSEQHARRRLANWLADLASGASSDSPLGKAGQLILECLGPVDSTNSRSADRTGGEHLHGKALPGGAPSLGKRR